MLTQQWKHLKRLMGELEQQFGQGLIQPPTLKKVETAEVWSSGSWNLDQALGIGGYPKGRMIEIFGAPGTGKSTLALHAVQACQQAGGLAVYIDVEHTLDTQYAGVLGVKLNELLVVKPQNAEQALGALETLVKSGQVGLIVLDSIAALAAQQEIEEGWQGKTKFLQAQLLSRTLRRLSTFLHRTPTTLLFLNQLRYHQRAPHVLLETTPGGHALKFYASVRLELQHLRHLLTGGHNVGQHVLARVVKHKLASPYQEAKLTLRYGEGIDGCAEWLSRACSVGIVTVEKTGYTCEKTYLGADYDEALQRLRRELPLQERLQQLIKQHPPLPPPQKARDLREPLSP